MSEILFDRQMMGILVQTTPPLGALNRRRYKRHTFYTIVNGRNIDVFR
jgi:hypothetical protein